MSYLDSSFEKYKESLNQCWIYTAQNGDQTVIKAEKKNVWNNLKIAVLNWFGCAGHYQLDNIIKAAEHLTSGSDKQTVIKPLQTKIRCHIEKKPGNIFERIKLLQIVETILGQPLILTHLSIAKPSPKVFTPPHLKKMSAFNPLTDAQVEALLNKVPELKTKLVAQGIMTAEVSIKVIHKAGISTIKNQIAKDELRDQMRFILFKINAETNTQRQKELLLELACGLEDCTPVTQGRVAAMYMKLSSSNHFVDQIEYALNQAKERAAEEALYEMFPEMQNAGYAQKYHGQPYLQFPHMKSGFIAQCGKEIGIDPQISEGDPNKNTEAPKTRGEEFIRIFKTKFSIESVIKEFIISVNRPDPDGNNTINTAFMNWWNDNIPEGMDKHDIFHNEDTPRNYPIYAPFSNDSEYQAYVDEEIALKVFQKLGYIE